MRNDGYAYIDVRSEQEFEAGHPWGAYNVPLMHMAPGGMVANADFIAVIVATFGATARLVVGCKAGGRSQRACGSIAAAGFVNIVDHFAGFDGVRDAFGAVTEPGWSRVGLPVENGQPDGRSYEALRRYCPGPTRA
jgi:rhodanese-related sulfurtransferase